MKKLLTKLIRYKFAFLLILLVALFAKPLHEHILRSYVGSKVVKLKGINSGGTGFFVKGKSGKTYIMTNRHVCKVKDKSSYLNASRGESVIRVRVKVIEESKKHDLCLIESFDTTVGLDLADGIDKNETVMAIGHPGLEHLILSKGKFIANTIISIITSYNVINEKECLGKLIDVNHPLAFNVCVKEFMSSRIFLYIRPGSSGSPLVNFFGNIVGVIFAGNSEDHLKSYAVPLQYVKDFLKDY